MSVFDYYDNESARHWIRLLHKEQDPLTLLELSAQMLELNPEDLENSRPVISALITAIWRVLVNEDPTPDTWAEPDTGAEPEPEFETAMDQPTVVLVFGSAHYGVLLRDPRLQLDDQRSPLLRLRDADDVPRLPSDEGYVTTWEPYPTDGWPGDLANAVPFDDLDDNAQEKVLEQVDLATSDIPTFLAGLRKMIQKEEQDT